MSDNNENRFCVICRRSEDKAGPLIRFMGDMCVCTDCFQKALDLSRAFGGNIPGMDPATLDRMFGGNGAPGSDPKAAPSGPSNDNSDQAVAQDTSKDQKVLTEEDINKGADETDKPGDDSEGEGNDRRGSGMFMGNGFPNISFLNLSELQNALSGKPRTPKKKKKPLEPIDLKNVLPPHKIKERLDEYVIGQELAKKIISVAVYNHYKRVATGTMDEIEIEKSNILMIGPTGSGKTYLVKTLAKLLDVPLAIADATSLTEAGYIGDDIESVVSKLLAAADNDVERAERGIIFIDEIDKIAKKKETHSRDVSGESVQQGMLKLLEGAEIEVPVGSNSKNAMVPLATVNTRNILFICGGAFPDLEEIIKQRLHKETSIGFSAELKDKIDKEKNILTKVTVEDIKKFGMIPEFVGRLPVICPMEILDKDMLVQILKEPKNAILKQYKKLLELDEVELEFSDDALEAIAEKALERDTGARALRAIIEDFMLDIMYEIPKDKNIGRVTITADYINGTGGPVIELRTTPVPQIAAQG